MGECDDTPEAHRSGTRHLASQRALACTSCSKSGIRSGTPAYQQPRAIARPPGADDRRRTSPPRAPVSTDVRRSGAGWQSSKVVVLDSGLGRGGPRVRTLASSSTVGEAISHRPWHPDCTLLLMQHALLAPSIGALFGAYVATEAWTHRWGFKVHYLYLYGYFELAQSPLGRAVRHTTLFRPRRRQ